MLNFLENCPEQIRNKREGFIFKIPELRSVKVNDVTKNEALAFVDKALDKLKDDYNYRNPTSKRSDCTALYCRAIDTKPSYLFRQFMAFINETKTEESKKVDCAKTSPLSIDECKTTDQVVKYLFAYKYLWQRFSGLNHLKHIDNHNFIARRTKSEMQALGKQQPNCLKGSDLHKPKTDRGTTCSTRRSGSS